MKSIRKLLFGASAFLLSGSMIFSAALPSLQSSGKELNAGNGAQTGLVNDVTGKVNVDLSQYFDDSVVQALPETVTSDQQISVILSLEGETVLDAFDSLENSDLSIGEFVASKEGQAISTRIRKQSDTLLKKLTNAGVRYTVGNRYDTLLGGVEVNIKASAFNTLCKTVKGQAGVMVGEVYAPCETVPYENTVNVVEKTGIFDSSNSEYDGTGTVIAVLDTGLDYTHSAFSEEGFSADPDKDVITMQTLQPLMSRLEASKMTPGLTAANVYLSRKVPFAYDYADGDDNVSPINSEHGTHVAGVMVGLDSEIRGVAPNAQLAVMKVFAEGAEGARTSWLLAALEDCVVLDVDVINMSLGSSSGFSRETDNDQRYAIYDRIHEHGISLVAAASNDYNSTFGSEKNGNLGLTSNPDSATVGAPSTYEAALSVASISGVKTPYLLYQDNIVYFTESSDSAAKPKNFVDDILNYGAEKGYIPTGVDSYEFEYEIIPGVGRAADFTDYANGELNGKIALIKRGSTNFEEKAGLARQYGAVGCIIYNNVSGTISMNVGRLGNFPVCSLSQDDGGLLVRGGNGKIKIARDQTAGPFMSDFSSWGPTPDLRIKPEITAHGGDIYSAVPGQSYDRLSGTSMASPNQAGVTALVRQYVKDTFGLTGNDNETRRQITAAVNQLMMSTADIALNTNGLPFSVRKQGAGLANLDKATHSPAYLQTFERDTGALMDKTKIELGDDPDKNGVYELRFNIVNRGTSALSYDVDAVVMTEGVSEQLTDAGLTTVTEKGYLLEGAEIAITGHENCDVSDHSVTVPANRTATVTVTVTLSQANKDYLNASFSNGMYVEGFVTLTDKNGGTTQYNLNAPFLAYFGDWGAAPLFDLDYFATYADELDEVKENWEKVLPDAYATRPIGGLYNDYIVYLGAFPYLQDPNSTTKIGADREHIALSNQVGNEEGTQSSTVNSINGVYLGLLRGAKRMVTTITDTSTGEVIFTKEERDVHKCYNRGGGIYASNYDIDFYVADYDLKNNTKYMVTLTGYIDYRDGTVANNTFEFPFYTDFTAPIVTGVEYTYEYDRDTEENRLYANVSIYDNHYVMGIIPGYISQDSDGYRLYGFQRYITPITGERNTTSVVQIELTDYLDDIKAGSYNHNSFIVQVMDWAENTSTFELTIPDDIASVHFEEEEIQISPNQLYPLKPVISPSQEKAWAESLTYTSENEEIARVVNGKLVGVASGETTITATSNRNPDVTAKVKVVVLKDGDPGFHEYNQPIADDFRLTGYLVNRVYYFMSSNERDLGAAEAGTIVQFASSNYSLKMFPSESVTIQYDLTGYFDAKNYKVEYTSSDPTVVTVDRETGEITAKNVDAEGNPLNSERTATISVRLLMRDPETGDFKSTINTRMIFVTVKESYTTNGPYLMSYMGLGGKVVIPEELGITEIQSFAFSNYDFIPKDLSAGDEITEEDPYYSKQWYIGDNTITDIVVPEGVKTIQMYAFANLTALRSISLPSTLTKIQVGAFMNCTQLSKIEFPKGNNLQFINQQAFQGCEKLNRFDFKSIIAIGDYAFDHAGLISIQLPSATQSIGAGAFAGNTYLTNVTIAASKVKIGAAAFNGCTQLTSMRLNASVLPANIFQGCTQLTSLHIGPDVEVIGEFALAGTLINTLDLDSGNQYYEKGNNGQYLLEKGTGVLALVAPNINPRFTLSDSKITEIGTGAFSGTNVVSVTIPSVTRVDDYAFGQCASLQTLDVGQLEYVGDYAFYGTRLNTLPSIKEGAEIGERAFFGSALKEVTLPAGVQVGDYAFAEQSTRTVAGSTTTVNYTLQKVNVTGSNTPEEGTVLGEAAFFANPVLTTVEVGDNATIGTAAFSTVDSITLSETIFFSGETITMGSETFRVFIDPYLSAISSVKIGNNVTIGDYAFRGAGSFYTNIGGTSYGGQLKSVQLGNNVAIGNYAFFGCHYLTEIDLSKAASIGSYAFAGTVDAYALDQNGSVRGYLGAIGYGAEIDHATLTGLDTANENALGEGAFLYNQSLATVTLPETLTALPDGVFANCTALSSVDLKNITSIGASAFGNTALTGVTVAEGASIGDEAFYGCNALTRVDNLNKAVSIGARAFEGTAITALSLEEATSLGDFAFADSALTSVVLGEKLVTLGENPFAGCAIGEFTKEENGAVTNTFDIGEKVKVVDGVLYGSCPNGLVLVCYPMEKEGKSFTVTKDVVRVSARAFLGADLLSVELSRRVKAIGDMAFYGCENLAVVVFTSVEAPILEEQFHTEFETGVDEDGMPYYLSYNVGSYEYNGQEYGLSAVPFRLWNIDATCMLHGANFISAIGTKEGREVQKNRTLVMVRPINGTGYENFLYEQYFDVVVDGVTAITDATQAVIDGIDALPESVTLDDQATVEGLRAAYNALPAAQQGRVDNISKLEAAESRIDFLLFESGGNTPPEPSDDKGASYLWLYILLGVVAVAGIAAAVVVLIMRKQKKEETSGEEPAASSSENAEEAENAEKGDEEKKENAAADQPQDQEETEGSDKEDL